MDNVDDLIFLPLGGAGEIGMNLNLYGYKGKWIMVDCGISFDHDLGLEVVMPDPAFIEAHKSDLLGIVLTHAHEDHIGALPYLWHRFKAPMYATPFTSILIKEKLRESGHLREASVNNVPLGGSVTLGPFQIEFITLTHSIPEPNALAIKTPKGIILHTGDWKIDPEPLVGKSTDSDRLKQLGDEGVLALVCDSTNSMVKGRSGSEAHVRKELIKVIKKQKGKRVTIACFASNIARLTSAAVAAQQTGRKVVLFGRSLHRMEEAARKSGFFKGIDKFITEKEMDLYDHDELLIISTGSQGEPRSALARIACGSHNKIKMSNQDTVIFSSRVIPGNEDQIRDMQEKLLETGVELIQDHDEDIHVSGHPARDDLKDMYSWTRPHILIPVHGEQRHMREQAALGKKCGIKHVIVPKNGAVIAIDREKMGIVDEVPSGRLALDGNSLVSRKESHLKERAKIAESGVVLLSVNLNALYASKGSAASARDLAISITLVGVVEPSLEADVIKALRAKVYEIVLEPAESTTSLAEELRIVVRRAVSEMKGKKPKVIVHLLQG